MANFRRVQALLEIADEEVAGARTLLDTSPRLARYHVQQSAEKAVLEHRGLNPGREHRFEPMAESQHYPSYKSSDCAPPQVGPGEPRRERNRKRQQRMVREEHHFVRQHQCRKGHRREADENVPAKGTIHNQPDQGKENAETGVLSEIFEEP